MLCDHHSAYTWQLNNCKRTVLYNFLQREGTSRDLQPNLQQEDMNDGMWMHVKSKRPKFQIGMSFFFPFRSQLQVIEDGQFKLRWLIYRYLQSDHGTYERVLLQQIASLQTNGIKWTLLAEQNIRFLSRRRRMNKPAWFREEKERILWQMFMIGCD